MSNLKKKKTDEGRVHDSSRIIYVFRSFDNIEKKKKYKNHDGNTSVVKFAVSSNFFFGDYRFRWSVRR